MPTYNSVGFDVVMDGDWRPEWEQEANINREHFPWTNKDDVQALGRGNYRITLTALIDSDADAAALRSSVGVTTRTLTDLFGTTYTGVMLVGYRRPRRHELEELWQVELEFEREGA